MSQPLQQALTVVSVLFVITMVIWVYRLIFKHDDRKKSRAKPQRPVATVVIPPKPDVAPAEQQPVTKAEVAVPEATEEDATELVSLAEALQQRLDVGESMALALPQVIKAYDTLGDLDELFETLEDTPATTHDIITALLQCGSPLEAVISTVGRQEKLDAAGLVATFVPLLPGDAPIARAAELFRIVQCCEDANWLDGSRGSYNPIDFFSPLLEQGCTANDLVVLLYQQTDLRLGNIYSELGDRLSRRPETVAAIVQQLRLTWDNDELETYLEEVSPELNEMITILRLSGLTAKETAEILEGTSADDEILALLQSFINAGYSPRETLLGLYHGQTDPTAAALVDAAVDSKVLMEEIVGFLKGVKVNPEELNEELDEYDIDFKTRITLLYQLVSSDPSHTTTPADA